MAIKKCADSSYIRVMVNEDPVMEPLSAMPKPVLESLLKTAKEQEEERTHKLNIIQDTQDRVRVRD